MINNPSVLLADEPTGNLDTRTSYDIMQTLQSLNREQGVTIIVVTHELDIAAYADRTITMRDGQVISDERKRSGRAPQGAAGLPVDQQQPAPAAPTARSGAVWAFGVMIMAAAIQALARNKMRSALTMLGVFIGVAALIAMVAVGQGANEAVRKQIESLGTNLLVVVPGASTMGGIRSGLGSASTLTVVDAEALRREAPAVGSVSYLIRQIGTGADMPIRTGRRTFKASVPIIRPSPIGKSLQDAAFRQRTTTAPFWSWSLARPSPANCSALTRTRSARSSRSRACRYA